MSEPGARHDVVRKLCWGIDIENRPQYANEPEYVNAALPVGEIGIRSLRSRIKSLELDFLEMFHSITNYEL